MQLIGGSRLRRRGRRHVEAVHAPIGCRARTHHGEHEQQQMCDPSHIRRHPTQRLGIAARGRCGQQPFLDVATPAGVGGHGVGEVVATPNQLADAHGQLVEPRGVVSGRGDRPPGDCLFVGVEHERPVIVGQGVGHVEAACRVRLRCRAPLPRSWRSRRRRSVRVAWEWHRVFPSCRHRSTADRRDSPPPSPARPRSRTPRGVRRRRRPR